MKIKTKEELVKALEYMANAIKASDSFEGSIMYVATDTKDTFEVSAMWRVGNSNGQGGCIMI